MGKQENPEIYCVTGVQGSGKTAFCEEMKKSGDFEVVEKDDELQKFSNENLEEEVKRAMDYKNFSSHQDWFKTIALVGSRVRQRILELISSSHWPGFEELAAMVRGLNGILKADDLKLMELSIEHRILNNTLILLASQKAIKLAAEEALKNKKSVLLADISHIRKPQRLAAVKYLNHHDLNPCLVVVRSTKEHLLHVARARKQIGSTGVWYGRDKLPDFKDLDPVTGDEGWQKVVVVDNQIGQSLSSIHQSLLSGVSCVMEGQQIGFLTPKA